MSGALPTTRAPAEVQISSWSPTFVSVSQSLKEQARRRGAGVQRWKLSFNYGTMERGDYLDLWAFLNAQRGQFDTFTAVIPAGISPRGALGGTPLAFGAAVAGVSSVAIDGLSNNITGWGKRGDFFKWSGHTKVYQLTADADSNGSGQATLVFMPALAVAVADNEAVTISSVPFTLRLLADENALSLQPPTQGVLQFAAIERY
jgi:hypothetical protein